ncbi:diguanylate cyclase domain-containing protein [Niallia endozanthoxylica]|nr:diguanylate cyclase [Niallia endozanthoxylica]
MGLLNKISNLFKQKMNTSQQLEIGKNPLFTQHPDATLVLNKDNQILFMNHQATALLGYTLKEGKSSLSKWMSVDMYEKMKSSIQQSLNSESASVDVLLLHQKGYEIPVSLTLIPNGSDFFYCICKDLRTLNEYKNQISKLYDNLLYIQKITNIGSFDYDVVNDKAFWSHQTYQIFGVDDDDFTPSWKNIVQSIHPNDRTFYEETIQKAIDTGQGYEMEHRILRSGGEERIAFQRGDVMIDETGKSVRLIGTIQDITEQKTIELKLIQNEVQMKSVTDRLHVGIWSYDVRQKRFTLCSKGMEKIYGVDQKEFLERHSTWFKYIHPEDLFSALYFFKHSMNGEEMTYEHRIIDREGKMKWIHHQVLPYKNSDGKVIRLDGIIADITKDKEHKETLTFNANHDHLTKLPNRRYFEKELEELLQHSQQSSEKFAVFYLDLDGFKLVNDTLGHEIGDKLLIHVAERLKNILGEHTFLARLGGDEFAVCVKQFENNEEVSTIANRIILAMKEPFHLNHELVNTATSIGISFFPKDGQDAPTLLKKADFALYQAKEAGRGNWKFYS